MSDAEVRRLILENGRLRANQLPHCRGCKHVRLHECGAFWYCPKLGAVDLDVDGCSKRKEGPGA